MADEAIISTADEIAGQVGGSVESIENATQETTPDFVPARDLMALKDKSERQKNELREKDAEIARLKASQATVSDDDDFSEYSDADKVILEKLASKAEKKAIAELDKRLAAQSQFAITEKKIDTMIDNQLELARQNGVKLPPTLDKELLKSIAKANPKEHISVLLERIYGIDTQGRATTENDMRPATDIVSETVDIQKITPEQKERIMKDPKAKKAYFDALDKMGM